MAEEPVPQSYALVRGEYVLAVGPRDAIEPRMSPGDEIMPYTPQVEPGQTVFLIDRPAGIVRPVTKAQADTAEAQRAWRTHERALAYPFLSDQVGAILKQIELMTEPDQRHSEFQGVLDKVAAVKQQVP